MATLPLTDDLGASAEVLALISMAMQANGLVAAMQVAVDGVFQA